MIITIMTWMDAGDAALVVAMVVQHQLAHFTGTNNDLSIITSCPASGSVEFCSQMLTNLQICSHPLVLALRQITASTSQD